LTAFTAVLDACVLYPAPIRDLLLQLATAGLFRARWTDHIHEEWIAGVLRDRADLTREQLERTRVLMNTSAGDSLVSGHDYLIPTINLPDQDDRHVVAAAIHARADAIVTYNLRDFPSEALERHHVEAIHPDDFLTYQLDLDEPSVLVAVQRCRTRLVNPPVEIEAYLNRLESLQLPKFVSRLRQYASIL